MIALIELFVTNVSPVAIKLLLNLIVSTAALYLFCAQSFMWSSILTALLSKKK